MNTSTQEPKWAALKFGLVLACAGLLVACAAPPQGPPTAATFADPRQWTDSIALHSVTIADRFAAESVVAHPPVTEIVRCLPGATPASVAVAAQRVTGPPTEVNYFSQLRSSRQYAWNRGLGICYSRSAAGFPILAAEAFVGTVDPVGVPESIALDWRKQLAHRIATHGRVKVAFVHANGNLSLAEFWVTPTSGPAIHYAVQFYPAGALDNLGVDFRWQHAQLAAVRATVGVPRSVKAFPLSHRLTPAPNISPLPFPLPVPVPQPIPGRRPDRSVQSI